MAVLVRRDVVVLVGSGAVAPAAGTGGRREMVSPGPGQTLTVRVVERQRVEREVVGSHRERPVERRGIDVGLADQGQDHEHARVGVPGSGEGHLEWSQRLAPAGHPDEVDAAQLHGDDRDEQDAGRRP
jgi:hypothetical protein